MSKLHPSQIVAMIVLVIATWMYLREPPSPEAAALRATGLQTKDACLIAAYIRAYGDMVVEDAIREQPFIATVGDLKLKMRDIGDLVIGTGWKIGERYPDLAPLLAGYFKIDTLDREAFHTQTHALADVLESV